MTSVHLLRTQDKLSQIRHIRDHSGETPDWLCRRGALARFIHSDSWVAVSNLAGTAQGHSSISALCTWILLTSSGSGVEAHPCWLRTLPAWQSCLTQAWSHCKPDLSLSSFASLMLHGARATQPAGPVVILIWDHCPTVFCTNRTVNGLIVSKDDNGIFRILKKNQTTKLQSRKLSVLLVFKDARYFQLYFSLFLASSTVGKWS